MEPNKASELLIHNGLVEDQLFERIVRLEKSSLLNVFSEFNESPSPKRLKKTVNEITSQVLKPSGDGGTCHKAA